MHKLCSMYVVKVRYLSQLYYISSCIKYNFGSLISSPITWRPYKIIFIHFLSSELTCFRIENMFCVHLGTINYELNSIYVFNSYANIT